MRRTLRVTMLLICVVLVPCLGLCQGQGSLVPLELRKHYSLPADGVDLLGFSSDIQEQLVSVPPQISWIMRGWYDELPPDNRWSPEGAKRSETIVLVDTSVDGRTFSWRDARDYSTGIVNYELVLSDGPDSKRTLQLEVDFGITGSDMASSTQEFGKRLQEGQLPSDDQVLITFSLGGREWTATYADWMAGSFPSADRELLDLELDDELVADLDLVARFARITPYLFIACRSLVAPLTGTEVSACKDTEGWRRMTSVRGERDCSFDARFGYPCSLEQDQHVRPPRRGDLVPSERVNGSD